MTNHHPAPRLGRVPSPGATPPLGAVPYLGELSWPRVPHPRPLVAIPLGSTEQHGPHLPVDTDTRIASAVAGALAASTSGVVVAPALAYGAAGEHAGFPGTLSTGAAVLELVVVELVRSADDTARGVVLVNGHGGNARAVRRAAGTLTAEGRRVLVWAPTARLNGLVGVPDPAGDLHAGRSETSLLLHLRPDLVNLAAAVAAPAPPLADLFAHGVQAASPSGVLGDPRGASADEGARLLAAYVSDLVAAVTAWDTQ